MLVKLSTKGQLVIPKAIRCSLGLQPGDRLQVQVVEGKIILEPAAAASPIESLYGRYAGCDLIGELEREHRREIAHEQPLRV